MSKDGLSVSEVARRIGRSSDRVRQLERRGELVAAIKTAAGVRIFLRSDVDEYLRRRESKRKAIGSPGFGAPEHRVAPGGSTR